MRHLHFVNLNILSIFVFFCHFFVNFFKTALGSCEEITVKSCANAGYKFTARFGKQFQDYKGQLLDTLLPLLQSCSQHSSLILCSLYLPKCIEGVGRPMLPCRQVCLDFAEKCKSQLQYASTHGMTVALCDLLPVYDGTSDKCIMPRNFQSSNLCKLNININT